MKSLWQLEAGHLVCHWSEVRRGTAYQPAWMRDLAEVQGSYLLPIPDFCSFSPFGGPSWFDRNYHCGDSQYPPNAP